LKAIGANGEWAYADELGGDNIALVPLEGNIQKPLPDHLGLGKDDQEPEFSTAHGVAAGLFHYAGAEIFGGITFYYAVAGW